MTKTFAAAALILTLATSTALAQEHRGGDAALGALSGAVVLGPIGAVAGAVIGYTAGPSIARSWGFDRRGSARRPRQASRESVRRARAEAIGNPAGKNASVASTRSEASSPPPVAQPSAPSATSAQPPMQTLE
jgi:hypothetical protein